MTVRRPPDATAGQPQGRDGSMDDRLTMLVMDATTSAGRRSAANLMGWLSLGSWVCNTLPCIWENYKLQSGEGVSFWFILIWLVGDLTNFAGSYRQGLLPTMILLAVYYTLCDLSIMFQIYYYRWKSSRPHPSSSAPVSGTTETAPLLSASPPAPSTEDLSPRPRKSTSWSRFKAALVLYSLAFGTILIVGFGGWLITEGRIRIPGRGAGGPSPPSEGDGGEGGEKWDTGAQVVGWISAAAYLGSRLPQILKNMKTKCHGLSMLFFITGLIGNGSYTASIFLASTSPAHIWINLSWIVGAAGTIGLDFIVLYQFWLYRKERVEMDEAAAAEADSKDAGRVGQGESAVLAVI